MCSSDLNNKDQLVDDLKKIIAQETDPIVRKLLEKNLRFIQSLDTVDIGGVFQYA